MPTKAEISVSVGTRGAVLARSALPVSSSTHSRMREELGVCPVPLLAEVGAGCRAVVVVVVVVIGTWSSSSFRSSCAVVISSGRSGRA